MAKQGNKVLLVDADAQVHLTMSLGYTRLDDIPVTLSNIMQDIMDDKPVDMQGATLHWAAVRFDLFNTKTGHAHLESINKDERTLCLRYLSHLCGMESFEKELVIMDRCYASAELVQAFLRIASSRPY